MEAMIALGMVMLVIFGGLGMALVMGYLSTEKARLMEEDARRGEVAQAARAIPGFFVVPARAEHSGQLPELDEALLARLESHVREEQALVSDFVHHPSVSSLYRQGPQTLRMH